jgi:hypothetical protein
VDHRRSVPVNDGQRLLVVRPQDLVVLGARCSGFELDGGELVADFGGGFVELTFPPQATGEMAFDPATGAVAPARLGGPSQVTLAVAAGTRVPLNADGFIAALSSASPVVGEEPFFAPSIAVELPWRLTTSPQPASTGDTLRLELPPSAVAGPTEAVGLWQTWIEAAGGLSLVPLEVGEDGDIQPPLERGKRDRIVAEANATKPPPTAPRLGLSALGGTLTANGTWPTFSWQQEIVLGRDMAVRTETKGFLFPFGHRAVLIDDTHRVLEPEAPANATAGLIRRRTLIVSEPVRGPVEDPRLAREFPFDEVEILGRAFELKPDQEEVAGFAAPKAKSLQGLREELASDQTSLADAKAAIPGLLEEFRKSLREAADREMADGQTRLGEISPVIRDLEATDKAARSFVPHNPPFKPPELIPEFGGESTGSTETPPPPEEGPPGLTAGQGEELRRLLAEAQGIEAGLGAIATRLERELAQVSEDSIAENKTVVTAKALRESIPKLEAHIAEVAKTAETELPIYEWPLAPGGERLQIPIRFGDVRTASPVLFVYDIDMSETDDFERFAPLSNPEVQKTLVANWKMEEAGILPLPGTPIDLVRAETPQPSDVVPVHELTLAGAIHEGGFRPQIEQLRAELPAVRALVPNAEPLTRLAFDEDYLAKGAAQEVALRLADGVGVDFSKAADRAGGLIAPVFRADALSRLHGPVDSNLLPGLPQPPDLASVFDGATLLGIPLGSLLDPAVLPEPMKLIAEPGGGARMTWSDLPLRSSGPLLVDDKTKLNLIVIQSPSQTVTTCTLEHFTLVLPPGSDGLLELKFAKLSFTQEAGKAPNLAVEGLEVELGGDLGLLKTLQDEVDLGDALPRIHATPQGMTASYALDLPEVEAGMFLMRNISVGVGVEVPFDGRPVVAKLSFCSPEDPFNLSVLSFGGGGYLRFEIVQGGDQTLEASLDFGSSVAIGVGIATAEAHALGGVRFLQQGSKVTVTGFIRIGGSVEVLGLVSISVDLRVELSYAGGVLSGRATVAVEIDVTFWSGSITLDSGTFVLAGAEAPAAISSAKVSAPPPELPDWKRYRDAFAPVGS